MLPSLRTPLGLPALAWRGRSADLVDIFKRGGQSSMYAADTFLMYPFSFVSLLSDKGQLLFLYVSIKNVFPRVKLCLR